MSKGPTTLLKHPAWIETDGVRMDARPAERLRGFAEKWLNKSGTRTTAAIRAAMGSDDHPVAHHAAWLQFHSIRGLKLIAKFPQDLQGVLRELWAHGFHAGARHETITVNLKYLKDVQGRHASRAVLANGRVVSADRRRKVTDAQLAQMKRDGLTREQMAERADVTPQAIGKRLKKLKK